jgi:hypothetical protein
MSMRPIVRPPLSQTTAQGGAQSSTVNPPASHGTPAVLPRRDSFALGNTGSGRPVSNVAREPAITADATLKLPLSNPVHGVWDHERMSTALSFDVPLRSIRDALGSPAAVANVSAPLGGPSSAQLDVRHDFTGDAMRVSVNPLSVPQALQTVMLMVTLQDGKTLALTVVPEKFVLDVTTLEQARIKAEIETSVGSANSWRNAVERYTRLAAEGPPSDVQLIKLAQDHDSAVASLERRRGDLRSAWHALPPGEKGNAILHNSLLVAEMPALGQVARQMVDASNRAITTRKELDTARVMARHIPATAQQTRVAHLEERLREREGAVSRIHGELRNLLDSTPNVLDRIFQTAEPLILRRNDLTPLKTLEANARWLGEGRKAADARTRREGEGFGPWVEGRLNHAKEQLANAQAQHKTLETQLHTLRGPVLMNLDGQGRPQEMTQLLPN